MAFIQTIEFTSTHISEITYLMSEGHLTPSLATLARR